jgi:pleiotropic regulator 1
MEGAALEGAVARLVRRRHELFAGEDGAGAFPDLGLGSGAPAARKLRLAARMVSEFKDMGELARAANERDAARAEPQRAKGRPGAPGAKSALSAHGPAASKAGATATEAATGTPLSSSAPSSSVKALLGEWQAEREGTTPGSGSNGNNSSSNSNTAIVVSRASGEATGANPLARLGAPELAAPESRALALRRQAVEPVRPKWHAPWVLKQVIAGHLGWVKCVAVDPSNEFFFTGSADRTIKAWDLASGQLKLTLTAHSHAVAGLAVSSRSPYLFSAGEDKNVLCWDLETNKVVRRYHGHLQGVYCVAVHPQLDLLVTGSRDASVRVWDVRTRKEVQLLTGHTDTVQSLVVNSVDPQVISGSQDKTVRLWDLAAGRTMVQLTHHKKSVRALAVNPNEFSFCSGAADALKKWEGRTGKLMLNLHKERHAIINTLACSQHDVLFAGGDDGSLAFYDWQSGHRFSTGRTMPQPGSLDSEACVLAAAFDVTGTRLITCEADKSIKIWKEDPAASERSHPLTWDREAAVREQLEQRY